MPKKSESQKTNKGWSSMRRRARKADREEGAGNMSDYRQKIRGKKRAEGNKKNGCFPKLFMLVLPLVAVGTYLLLA
jgi:hypothetical protein